MFCFFFFFFGLANRTAVLMQPPGVNYVKSNRNPVWYSIVVRVSGTLFCSVFTLVVKMCALLCWWWKLLSLCNRVNLLLVRDQYSFVCQQVSVVGHLLGRTEELSKSFEAYISKRLVS